MMFTYLVERSVYKHIVRYAVFISFFIVASVSFGQIDFDFTSTGLSQEVEFKYNANFYNKYVAGGFVLRDNEYRCVGSDTLDFSFNQSSKTFKVYGDPTGEIGYVEAEELLFFIFPYNADSCALKLDLFVENGSSNLYQSGSTTVIDSSHAIRGTVEYPGEVCLGESGVVPNVNIPHIMTFFNESGSDFFIDSETGELDLISAQPGAHIIGISSNHCLNQSTWPLNFRDFPVEYLEEDDRVYCKGESMSFWTSALSGNLTRSAIDGVPVTALEDDTLLFQLTYSPTGCVVIDDVLINVREADGMVENATIVPENCSSLGSVDFPEHGYDQRDTMFIGSFQNSNSLLTDLINDVYEIEMVSTEGCKDTLIVDVFKDTSDFPIAELYKTLDVCLGDVIDVSETGTSTGFVRVLDGFNELALVDTVVLFNVTYGSCSGVDSVFVEIDPIYELDPGYSVVDQSCDLSGQIIFSLSVSEKNQISTMSLFNDGGSLVDSNSTFLFSGLTSGAYRVIGYSLIGCSVDLGQPEVGNNGIDFSTWEIGVTNKTCEELGSLIIDDNVSGEYAKSYLIQGNDTIESSTSVTFDNLESGDYDLLIESQDGCSQLFKVEVVFDGNCEGSIIYLVPNLNGPKQISFEDDGPIKVFNKAGFLLKSLDGPVVWNGMAEDGTLLPSGAYVVVFEDGSSKLLHVVD